MVKKIVSLSIAFVLMISSLIVGTVNFDNSAVKFGAGTGTPEIVETTKDLEELLSSIPSLKDYLENDDITDVKPDFKPFTMQEVGSAGNSKKGQKYYGDEMVNYQNTMKVEQDLQIFFTESAVYYHCIGESRDTNEYFDRGDDGKSTTMDQTTFIIKERTRTVYDVEIYYSKDLVLVKYNNYDIVTETCRSYNESYNTKWTEVEPDDDDESAILVPVLEALSETFGTWLEVVEVSEKDFQNSLKGLSQEEMAIEYTVYEFCNVFSGAWVDSITSSTDTNIGYLERLSSFIEGGLDTMFQKDGDKYVLGSGENNAYDKAFLAAVVGIPENVYSSAYADVEFNTNSSVVTVKQQANISQKAGGNISISTYTTFKNIGNTVVSVEDEKMESVYDSLGGSLREIFKEMMKEEKKNG